MNKVTIQLVTYNGEKYIPYLFDSLKNQSYKDWSLLILDNNSSDKTLELLKKHSTGLSQDVHIICSNKNTGFVAGHNQLFLQSDSEFVLILNNDLYLDPHSLQKLVNFIENKEKVATVAPRLMRWELERITDDSNLSISFSNKIDTLGLKLWRSRRVTELKVGEVWASGVVASLSVFGVSGACALIRRASAKKVGYSSNLFDDLYTMYKEDIDLAFRLRSAGYESFVLPEVVVYHDRTGSSPDALGDFSAAKNKQSQAVYIRRESYKNHLMNIYKNEYGQNFILDFPFIVWYELKKFIWFLVFDRGVLSGLKDLYKSRQELAKRREFNFKNRVVSWQEMRKWWN